MERYHAITFISLRIDYKSVEKVDNVNSYNESVINNFYSSTKYLIKA